MFLDLALLRRRRDLRLLVTGQAVSLFGSQLTLVAVPVQVYAITDSTVAVGLLGVVEFAPIVVLALLGGALADAFDRRKLIVGAQVGSALVAAALTVNALLPEPSLAVLYAGAAAIAGLYAIQRPSMDAMLPRLVEKHELKAAAAINGIVYSAGSIAGPALAGVIIATAGLEVAYAIDVATYGASLAALLLMRTPPPPPQAEPPSLKRVAEGFRFARRDQALLGSYVVDVHAMFFGIPVALFPALAVELGGDEATVGLLFAAPAVGAVLVSVTSRWTERVRHHGRAIVLSAAGWGVGIALFGLASTLPLALLALALAGGMDMISALFRSVLWNETVPDELRGRLAGIEMLSYTSGPLLGNARAGTTAAWLGPGTAIVAGGTIVVAGAALIAARLPRFWNYEGHGTAS